MRICARARWPQVFLWVFCVCAISALLIYPVMFNDAGACRYNDFQDFKT